MKKLLSLLLCGIIFLTGCQSTIDPVVTPDLQKPIDVGVEEPVETPKKIINKEIVTDKKDEVLKYLNKNNYEIKEGYSTYPTEEYPFPMYLNVDGNLKTIYLTHKDYYENSTNEHNNYNTQYKGTTNKTSSLINSFVGGTTSMDAVAETESIAIAPSAPSIFPTESYLNTSEYKNIKESGYLNVKTSPLSTFAADIDTASYTNFRKILLDKGSEQQMYFSENLHDIRIEEMLNYFDYNFNGKKYDNFKISAEIGNNPWNKDTKLMVVHIKAKDLTSEEISGSNLVFLVDSSGSMNSADKMGLLIESLKLMTNELTENDTVSLVTYSGDSKVVFEGLKGNEKDKIISKLEEIIAYGSTNGKGGIKKAYEIAQKYQENHSNSRIIMCSDGDLNVGLNSEDDLIDLVTEKRETGIYLSVLGFGLGNYKDNKMEALADNGNGNYYYIDSIKEGHKVLVEDITSTIMTIADDVKFQIEFNPEYIKGYRKIGYENRNMANEDFNDDTKDGGEVGYGHDVTIVYELVMIDSEMEIPNSELKYQTETETTGSNDWLTVSVRYKPHGEKESQLIEYIVDENNYKEENTSDWEFVSNVVGFGLIVNDSEYKNGLTLNQIIDGLKELELADEDKKEFYALTLCYNIYIDMADIPEEINK